MDNIQHQISNLFINSFYDINEFSTCSISVYRQNLVKIATFIKLNSYVECNMAIDAFVVDNAENEFRFTVIYLLQSTSQNHSIRVITKTNSYLAILSIQSIYSAFNWAEREMWDLSGIFFIKHPDLRRILTDYGFSGHPLRKDFPLSGFSEVSYSDKIKQVVYSPLELSQGLRSPTISVNWINA